MIKYITTLIIIAGTTSCTSSALPDTLLSTSVQDGIGNALVKIGIPFTGAICIVDSMGRARYGNKEALVEISNLLAKNPSETISTIIKECRTNWDKQVPIGEQFDELIEEIIREESERHASR